MVVPGGTANFIPEGFVSVEAVFGSFSSIVEHRVADRLRQNNLLFDGADLDELDHGQPGTKKYLDAKFKYNLKEVTMNSLKRHIRGVLYSGKITSFILTSDGKLVEMPSEIWGSNAFGSIVESGHAMLNEGPNSVRGRVLIRRDELEAVCDKWKSGRSAPRETTSAYVPPYIAFMLRATQELGLSESHRAPKEVVESWLREHWPSDFGTPTGNKISYMATFLRHPGDEKGGHFKPERIKT
jgi:hypothetical protein